MAPCRTVLTNVTAPSTRTNGTTPQYDTRQELATDLHARSTPSEMTVVLPVHDDHRLEDR